MLPPDNQRHSVRQRIAAWLGDDELDSKICAHQVFEEATPRSRVTVDDLAGPTVRRVRRQVQLIAGIFVAGSAIVWIIFWCRGGVHADDLESIVVAIAIAGGVPAWAVIRFMSPDGTVAPQLVRLGKAYRATVLTFREPPSLQAFAMATNHGYRTQVLRVLRLEWIENGVAAQGYVTCAWEIEAAEQQDIVVLVCPGISRIGVVVGCRGMFIGARGSGRGWY